MGRRTPCDAITSTAKISIVFILSQLMEVANAAENCYQVASGDICDAPGYGCADTTGQGRVPPAPPPCPAVTSTDTSALRSPELWLAGVAGGVVLTGLIISAKSIKDKCAASCARMWIRVTPQTAREAHGFTAAPPAEQPPIN